MKKTDSQPTWRSEDPLVYYHDDGSLMERGRHCVMSGGTVYMRFNTEHAARTTVDTILLAAAT